MAVIIDGPGYLARAALQAHEAEQRRRALAQEAIERLDGDELAEGLQRAVSRVLGQTVDAEELPRGSDGRPHVILDGLEFAPLAPTTAGWQLALVLRCPDCQRVGGELPIASLAYLGLVLEEGIADAQRCHSCAMGRVA